MSKENFYKTLNDIVDNERLSNEEAYIINDYVGYLEMNNKELTRLYKYEHEYGSYMEDKYIDEKARIDKAIEYIEHQNRFIEGCDIYLVTDWNYVLDILKGSDKE